MTEAKKTWTAEKAARMLLSVLSENAVKRITKDEGMSDNQGQCLERSWATLAHTCLASKEFKHEELNWQAEGDARQVVTKQVLSQSLYEAQTKTQSRTIDFKWVKCGRRKPNWSALAADHMNFPTVDLELLAHIEQTR